MGLDISLTRYEDFEKAKEVEEKYRIESNKIWDGVDKSYEEMTREEKDSCRMECDVLGSNMGLVDGEYIEGCEDILMDSAEHPDHLFKIGYIRSSYNTGGIDSLLRRTLKTDLAEIFGREAQPEFSPDWHESLSRLNSVIVRLKAMYRDKHFFDVMKVDTQFLSGLAKIDLPESLDKALDIFLKEYDKHKGRGAYSNVMGEFYMDEPVKVHALMPGKYSLGGRAENVVYAVYDCNIQWYLDGLDVIEDMIKYVIDTEEPEKYYLRWSG